MPLNNLLGVAAASLDAYKPKFNRGTDAKPRWIRPPNDVLKRIQRRILQSVLTEIPPHDAAFGAKARGGTIAAASQHLSMPYLLHLDISSFFPSVTPRRVYDRMVEIGMREDTAAILTQLVTVDNQLPQGAPTSSAIADLVLFPLDRRIAGLAAKHGWGYSRYVDDIALSGNRTIQAFGRRMVTRLATAEGWRINDKGGVFGPEDRKEILGLTVNGQLSVPAKYRHQIRSTLRLSQSGRIRFTSDQVDSLRGKIGWIFAVNPQQGRRLRLALAEAVAEGGGANSNSP